MARTQRQIEQSIATRINEQDDTIDTLKGAVPDIFIVPEATEIRALENRQDSIGFRYSFDYVQTQDRNVQILYGSNHGLRPSRGGPAVARGVAFRFTRPSEDIVIAAGRLVTTDDALIAFQVANDTTMFASRADTYFNASTRRYEVPVTLTSVGVGVDYDVPARTLRKLSEPIAGIDGIINTVRATPGKPEEDLTDYGIRVRRKFNGLDTTSADGLASMITNYAPTFVRDVIPVFSADEEYFQRRTRRAEWDLYIRGSRVEETETLFTAVGSASFILPTTPVVSVTEVRVNNVLTTFTYTPDLTPERRGSTMELPVVELSTIPAVGSTITVKYQYDSLIAQTQQYVDTTRKQAFKTKLVTRSAQPKMLRIRLAVRPTSTFDPVTVLDRVRDTVFEYMNLLTRRELALAPDLQNYIVKNNAGAASVTVLTFTPETSGTLEVEPIDLAPYEYIDTTESLLTITQV